MAHGSTASTTTVKGLQTKTDRALENFLAASEEVDSASKDGNLQGVRDSLVGLARDLNGLNEIRSNAYEAEDNSTQTVEAYHRLITHLLDLAGHGGGDSNPDMIQRTRACRRSPPPRSTRRSSARSWRRRCPRTPRRPRPVRERPAVRRIGAGKPDIRTAQLHQHLR
ncbi:nitrate- and nitrite sensing domain-containing protein [Streptomyces sp. F001]|uniref:nitrate- and nitrite sensing domain-containing protein n=1 Tax=Streptomyces sp. F001 TaxID=1510026 RepID=UPI001F0E157A|nr:nitrate- and nitrite sensing domain-containing protein [Streptomyces sp. F001]